MMKQPKIITRLEMAQREVARLTAERDALAKALKGMRSAAIEFSDLVEIKKGSSERLQRLHAAIMIDPLCAHAVERAQLVADVVEATNWQNVLTALAALDAHDKEAK